MRAPLRPIAFALALCAATAGLLAPAAAAATFDEALAVKRSGDHTRAITLFEELVAAEPRNAQYLFHLGTVQGWAGRTDEALATFERALQIAPQDADVRLGYGRVLAWSGKLVRAEEIFRALVAEQPGNLEALNMLARVLVWQRQLDAASALYGNILALHPDNTDALLGQGDVERLQERFNEARALYQRALELEPDSADIRQRLASVRGAGRWRLDAGVEWSSFSGNSREDWRGVNAALRYTLDRRTGVGLGYEYARRFRLTDTHYSIGADRRFTDRLSGQMRLGATPQADFLARRSLNASATWLWRPAREDRGATFLFADYRASGFAPGTAHSLWIGATQQLEHRLALTGKVLLTRNLNADFTSGWQMRLDGEPSDRWRWYVAYADAYESLSSSVFDFTRELRTRAVFGGIYREFSSTLGLRIDLTHEWAAGQPSRNAFHAGIVTRF